MDPQPVIVSLQGLLAEMDRRSGGRTTATNAALAVANAGLGAALAVALAALP